MIPVRVFCEGGWIERPAYAAEGERLPHRFAHERVRLIENPALMKAECPSCRRQITKEAAFRAIPEPYASGLRSPLGMVLIALADVGAIDLIWGGAGRSPHDVRVEHPRDRDVPAVDRL